MRHTCAQSRARCRIRRPAPTPASVTPTRVARRRMGVPRHERPPHGTQRGLASPCGSCEPVLRSSQAQFAKPGEAVRLTGNEDYSRLAHELTDRLGLDTPPVALAFVNEQPVGVEVLSAEGPSSCS